MNKFENIETFTIVNDAGEEEERQVILTFQSDSTNGHYIVFTSGDLDEDGSIEIEAARFDPEADELELIAIDNLAEQDLIQEEIDRMIEIEYSDEGDEVKH